MVITNHGLNKMHCKWIVVTNVQWIAQSTIIVISDGMNRVT